MAQNMSIIDIIMAKALAASASKAYTDQVAQSLTSALTELIDEMKSNETNILSLLTGLVPVAHKAGTTVSLSYTATVDDFAEASTPSARYTGTYLIHCVNWATAGRPYIGLLTYSGNVITTLTRTDIVTGFTPTITIDDSQIDISGAARITIYALR